MKSWWPALLIVFAGSVVGCATEPPLVEYTLARTALRSASDCESARFAPGFWHDAEEAFRRGEEFFKKENYSEAKEEFLLARAFAEKSENSARLQRFKSGEGAP